MADAGALFTSPGANPVEPPHAFLGGDGAERPPNVLNSAAATRSPYLRLLANPPPETVS